MAGQKNKGQSSRKFWPKMHGIIYIISEYLNRQGMVRNIYFRIYRLTMHGYVVETCVGEENCPLLMSKVRRIGKELFLFVNLQVRALVIQSLRADPSGLTPDDPLVRTRLCPPSRLWWERACLALAPGCGFCHVATTGHSAQPSSTSGIGRVVISRLGV